MIKSQYENTTGLSVLESGILLERELTNRVLAATMLGLAIKEQFDIKRTVNERTGSVDIELFRKASFGDQSTLDSNEKFLLGILFNNFRDDRIHFSDIAQLRPASVLDARSSIRNDVIHRLEQKGLLLYGGLHWRKITSMFFVRVLIIFASILAAIFPPLFVLRTVPYNDGTFSLAFSTSLIFTVIFIIPAYIVWREGLMTSLRLTKEGEKVVNVLRGYREFLLIAEKDRIDFHESPDAADRMITKHLPYAVLFGVEQAWLKQIPEK